MIDPTGSFLLTANERPAGTFDPRITRTGPNTGQLTNAGTGASVAAATSVLVVVP